MSTKRFNSYCDNENIRIRIDDDIKNKEVFHIYFAELDDAIYCKSKLNSILDLLNELHEEKEDAITKKEDAEYELLHLKEKYEELLEENEQLKQQKQQYKGQRDYLLFVIERTCSKELFEETKSYLKEVE